MEIDGRITILVDGNGARIEIHDTTSATTFVEIEMNAEQFMSALGRMGVCKVKSMTVSDLDRVGKKTLVEIHEFPLPGGVQTHSRPKDMAIEECARTCPPGWTPDNYFGSQDSFFQRDGKPWARTTIRKWVE